MDITQPTLRIADVVVRLDGSPMPNTDNVEKSYSERLFNYAHAASIREPHFLEFRLLHRLNLVHIQNDLAKFKGRILAQNSASEDDMKALRVTLHEYGESKKQIL